MTGETREAEMGDELIKTVHATVSADIYVMVFDNHLLYYWTDGAGEGSAYMFATAEEAEQDWRDHVGD